MTEVDLTIWLVGIVSLCFAIGGPIYGVLIAKGKKQQQAEARDDIMKDLLKTAKASEKYHEMHDEKLDRIIDGSNATHELIRNNTAVMGKVDATMTMLIQVLANK